MTINKKIYLGADHAGIEVKEHVKKILGELKISFEDLGTNDTTPCDYPLIAEKLGKKVVKDKARGILICGSGTGMTMAANKIPGVRSALCYDEYSARMSRKDNDTNILTLRGREFPKSRYHAIVTTWCTTPFAGAARHKRRITQLAKLDKK